MPPRTPPRYDPRRDRRRMTWIVFALGLVIICIVEASKPANWAWFAALGGRQKAGREARVQRDRVQPVEPVAPLAPGEFRLVEAEPSGDSPATEAEAPSHSEPAKDAALKIPQAILRTILDQSAGIRSSERMAYFAILVKARDIPAQELERAGDPHVGYAELMNDPERHRGQLVSLAGEMRRFLPIPAGENELGFETLYDGWMFTEDAGRKSPYRVIVSEKPEGFPEGEQIRERVQFTGYFFKRYSYDTAHGLHAAPLLIGKRIGWSPANSAAGETHGGKSYIVVGLGVLAAAFVIAFWRISTGDRRQQLSQTRRVRTPSAEAIANLNDMDVRDDSRFLEELADRERDPPTDSPRN